MKRTPNLAAAGNGAMAVPLHTERLRRAVPEPQRSASYAAISK